MQPNQDANIHGGSPPPISASTTDHDNDAASMLRLGIIIPWYSVIVGRNPGVFFGALSLFYKCATYGVYLTSLNFSTDLTDNVSGISNSQIIRHGSEAEARASFDSAVAEGRARRVIQFSSRREVYISEIGSLPPLSRPDFPEDLTPGRWYAVLAGREPGVYLGTKSILANTMNVPGHILVKFNTHREARQEFLRALFTGGVYEIEHTVHVEVLEAPLAVYD